MQIFQDDEGIKHEDVHIAMKYEGISYPLFSLEDTYCK